MLLFLAAMTAPLLVPEMTYVLEIEGPLEIQRRQFWQMTRATLEGPRLRASTAMPGIDWWPPPKSTHVAS